MAGRHRIPRQRYNEPWGSHDAHRPPFPRGQGAMSPRLMEEELARCRDEMQKIHADNQLLLEEIVGLQREMPLVKDGVHAFSQAIPELRAEKELEARGLTQRNLKLEAELRAIEPLTQEALALHSEAEKLEDLQRDMSAKVQGLLKDLMQHHSENQQIPSLRAEHDSLHQELLRARMAYEYEKEANSDLNGQVQAMEKNLVSMAQEAEKLRAELQKRANAAGAGSQGTFGVPTANPEMGFSGAYGDHYGSEKSNYDAGPWAPYGPHGYPHY